MELAKQVRKCSLLTAQVNSERPAKRKAKEYFLLARALAAVTILVFFLGHAHADTLSQDFELGQGLWFADNGVWEVGTPTYGPAECHQGTQCAGTILDGPYPHTSSRLISPAVQLGEGTISNPLLLKFWHWFEWGSTSGGLQGQGIVQISVLDTTLLTWSAWTNVSTAFSRSSGVWTLNLVDLTAFSGQVVRIGFFHMGANVTTTGAGWYVDEIELIGATSVGATSVGGSVTGMSPSTGKVTCRNMTTKKTVKITIPAGVGSWDCEEAGLVVNPGDKIKQTITVTGPAD